jgi:hypothetical protein
MPMLMPGHGQDEAKVIHRLRLQLSQEKRDAGSFGLQASLAIQPGREQDSISYAKVSVDCRKRLARLE